MGDRRAAAQSFLDRSGWQGAARVFLAGDASARRYERLRLGGSTAVLMDAPPEAGEDTGAFLRIAAHLHSLGLSAPQVFADDLENGFLLLEDLGDSLFARLAARKPECEPEIYSTAVDVLATLQAAPPPPGLVALAPADWAQAAALAPERYATSLTGEAPDTARFCETLTDLLSAHADGCKVMILRDYHSENLLWLPDRQGNARVGLLDFQLAQLGQPGYDLVSLCQDARRDVGLDLEASLIRHFLDLTGIDSAGFGASYAILGAQRALRIIGVFARLALDSAKPGYLALLPRVWDQLQRNLAHPALNGLAGLCAALLPPPTPANLERLRAQCPPGP